MEKNSITSRFPSPLRYPGGKSCIFPFMSNLFHENGLIGCSYAEPYAGGAGLALRLLYGEFVDKIYINDFDKSIYSFWSSILENNTEFCDWIEDVEVSIENWHFFKQIQSNPLGVTRFELAQSTFYLNRTNISGVIKGGPIGGHHQLGKYRIDARFNKNDLIKRISRIADYAARIKVSNLDGLQFIKNIDRRKEDIFTYLDPPYFLKGADLYMNFYAKKDHQKLAKAVHKFKKNWLVSYDNQDVILNLYSQPRKILYQLSQSASNRIGDEILVFSNGIEFSESMTKLNTPVLV